MTESNQYSVLCIARAREHTKGVFPTAPVKPSTVPEVKPRERVGTVLRSAERSILEVSYGNVVMGLYTERRRLSCSQL
jgi:hypothetical protein